MCNNQLHASSSKLHDQLHIKLHIYQVSKCPIKTSSSCSKPPKANLHVINQSNQVINKCSKASKSSSSKNHLQSLQSINQSKHLQSLQMHQPKSPSTSWIKPPNAKLHNVKPLQILNQDKMLSKSQSQTLAPRQVFTKGSKPRQKHQDKDGALLLLYSKP